MDLKKVKRTMKVGPKKGQELYGLQWINYGNVDNEALVEEIESQSTLSDSDIDIIINEFAKVVMRGVANGHTVDLGVMGSLRPTLSAKAADTEADAKAASIHNRGILYRSNSDLSLAAKSISMNVISGGTATSTAGSGNGTGTGSGNGNGNNNNNPTTPTDPGNNNSGDGDED